MAAGVLEAAAPDRPTWSILPPGAKAPLEAVKLSSPPILLAAMHPTPAALPQTLEFRPPSTTFSQPSPKSLNSGTQLSLIPATDPAADHEVPIAPVDPTPQAATPKTDSAQLSPRFALQAPMRLNPAVRDALTKTIDTLNQAMGPATVCTIAEGVFVPLEEFTRSGVQPSLAMRALSETAMLVKPNQDDPPTLSREFHGKTTVGIVLDPRFVSGLDLAGFVLVPQERS